MTGHKELLKKPITLFPVPYRSYSTRVFFFFLQAEDGIRDADVTGAQTCALPIYRGAGAHARGGEERERHRPGGRPEAATHRGLIVHRCPGRHGGHDRMARVVDLGGDGRWGLEIGRASCRERG